ncbi:MAG: acetyl-CoA C-acyltransferase [Flavobacteriales bacterium]
MRDKNVVIAAAVRTPIGRFMGRLATLTATELGSIAIENALQKINLDPATVDEVFMGNALQANAGQAPARQAALGAGIHEHTPCTTVNKVCASGMKAIAFATQAIKCGDAEIAVAGGMESMSRVPHYFDKGRSGQKLGGFEMVDGLLKDGLTDAYDSIHMGLCAEACAETYGFSRADQDGFAIESYKRAAAAWKSGRFADEVIPVTIPQRRGEPIVLKADEEYKNVQIDKIPQLRPVFKRDGTITAANASTLNDGAAALVITSAEKAGALHIKPLAQIISYADAAQAPKWFTTAPVQAVHKAIKKAGLKKTDIEYYELNEAFSVVVLALGKCLGLALEKINVNGGAVSLGHPLGMSGARIVITLLNALKQNDARYGVAGICNGGGGASAMVLENLG